MWFLKLNLQLWTQFFLVTKKAIFKNQKLDLYREKMRIIYSWKTLSEYSYVFDYLKNYQMLIKIASNPQNDTLIT